MHLLFVGDVHCDLHHAVVHRDLTAADGATQRACSGHVDTQILNATTRGAAPLISSRAVLASATGIALTEAQHAGVLRYLVYDRGIAVPQLDSLDVPPLGSPNGRVFNVFNEGLSPARTASQVLAIVYANKNAGARNGGFFPGGFNGTITTV